MAKSDSNSNSLRQDQPECLPERGGYTGVSQYRRVTPSFRPDVTKLSGRTSDTIFAADRRGGILILAPLRGATSLAIYPNTRLHKTPSTRRRFETDRHGCVWQMRDSTPETRLDAGETRQRREITPIACAFVQQTPTDVTRGHAQILSEFSDSSRNPTAPAATGSGHQRYINRGRATPRPLPRGGLRVPRRRIRRPRAAPPRCVRQAAARGSRPAPRRCGT